jgi:prepilin-type N-terminal cleavage/methylation domain-containing protein
MKTTLLKRYTQARAQTEPTTGFTLMEMFVVLIIIGILTAIAAPSWLAFLNGRRATDGASQILESFRYTQSEANKTRRPHIIELNPGNADPPIVRYGNASIPEGGREVQVIGGSEARPGLVKLEAVDSNGTQVNTLRFTGQGNLDTEFLRGNNYTLPIYLTVIAPSPDQNPNITGKKRCVIIQTLLGATRDGRDETCNR